MFYLMNHYNTDKIIILLFIIFIVSGAFSWQWIQSYTHKEKNLLAVNMFISLLEKKYKKNILHLY